MFKVSCVQLCSDNDIDNNLKKTIHYINQAIKIKSGSPESRVGGQPQRLFSVWTFVDSFFEKTFFAFPFLYMAS